MARNGFKNSVEYWALWLVLTIIYNIPYRWAMKIGELAGKLLWKMGVRASVSRKNIEIALGDVYLPYERDEILKNSYVNFCRSMVEYALLPRLGKNCVHRLVRFDGEEIFRDVADSGSGAIMITGHFGSWEMLGAALAASDFPVDFLVGRQRNKLVNEFMNSTRSKMGIGLIHIGVAARGVLTAVKKGRMVAMLSDQDAGHAGIETEFFGHTVLTPAGPAAFILRTKAPLLMGFIVRNDDNETHTAYLERLNLPQPTGDKDKDIQAITQVYTDRIAYYIERYPDMWFWAHKRFKASIEY